MRCNAESPHGAVISAKTFGIDDVCNFIFHKYIYRYLHLFFCIKYKYIIRARAHATLHLGGIDINLTVAARYVDGRVLTCGGLGQLSTSSNWGSCSKRRGA